MSSVVILSEPTVSSYGVIGRLYRDTFEAMGIRASVAPYPITGAPTVARGDVVLHATLGYRFTPAAGAINVAVPFHEWDRYPADWARRLNRFDAVWAASDHVARSLRASGVTAPIHFAPPALDLSPPRTRTVWNARRPFSFLFLGEPHFRKGHHLLIEGFRRLAAPAGAATLTIKTSASCPWTDATLGVRVIAADWPLPRLLDLYARHDAFVSASLGEGLGMGVAEAILARVPVATHPWGGHASLLAPGGYVKMAHTVVPQPYCSRPDFYAPGQRCALVSPDAIAAAMQTMLELSARTRREMADAAHTHLSRRFGLLGASRRLSRALAEVATRPSGGRGSRTARSPRA